eukprot:7650382-Ditylum_brightwellii.AAC.1
MGTVLDFKSSSSMMKAMGELEYDYIKDIVTMDVPMKLKKKLLHVLWWHNQEVLLRASKLVTTEDWLQLTADKFDIFVDTVAANMARTTIKTDPDAASTVTVKQ